MSVTIRQISLPHSDPEASLQFYRDGLGFVVREDVGLGAMRWLRFGSGPSGVALSLEPAIVGLDGPGAILTLEVDDLQSLFERLISLGFEPLQEPILRGLDQRDCMFLDPGGVVVRIVDSPLETPQPKVG
jgi:catechol 2,3-dioxygenase-like lactoylglutathione lyase family enzyme